MAMEIACGRVPVLLTYLKNSSTSFSRCESPVGSGGRGQTFTTDHRASPTIWMQVWRVSATPVVSPRRSRTVTLPGVCNEDEMRICGRWKALAMGIVPPDRGEWVRSDRGHYPIRLLTATYNNSLP